MIIIVILVYAFLFYMQMVPLYQNGQWREFWVNAFLGAFSFAVAILLSINVELPSPSGAITDFTISIFGK